MHRTCSPIKRYSAYYTAAGQKTKHLLAANCGFWAKQNGGGATRAPPPQVVFSCRRLNNAHADAALQPFQAGGHAATHKAGNIQHRVGDIAAAFVDEVFNVQPRVAGGPGDAG
ncbi:hypothetical protein SDC9_123406 [bioreactor metagenome]|uniref:Uncharacterized protein n=1 Tax=bioreactor metagenome TaxID=1076179 RepID=A0A645CHM7_9ZZZZ